MKSTRIIHASGLYGHKSFWIKKEVDVKITDTHRLNWLTENEAHVVNYQKDLGGNDWFLVGPSHLDHIRGTFKTARDCIDSAMEDTK